MNLEIIQDYLFGLRDSVSVVFLIKPIWNDLSIRKCIWKIMKTNFILHFMPFLLNYWVWYLFDWSLPNMIMNLLNYPINFFSIVFHIFHYLDLIGMVCKYSPKRSLTTGTIDMISLALTMSIYQLAIYLSTMLMYYIVPVFFVYAILNFIILAIYHSFYCFNSLWQHKQISIGHRIDIHEKLWPYYIGYGTIATGLYLYSSHPLVLGIYNIYLMVIIMLPFLLETRYPRTKSSYPKINMAVFSYIMSLVLSIAKKIVGKDISN